MRVSPINLSTFISKPMTKRTLAAVAAGLITVSCVNSGASNVKSKISGMEYKADEFEKSDVRTLTVEEINLKETLPAEQSDTRKKIGNILFYKGDLDEKVPVKTRKDTDGSIEYRVTLKSGTVLIYNEKQPNDAMVLDGVDLGYSGEYKNEGIKFSHCNLKCIRGTNKRDYYYLFASNVNQVDFGKCTEKNTKDELRLVGSNCLNIIAPDGYVRSEVKYGDVISMNEGWFERAEWLEEAMHEF